MLSGLRACSLEAARFNKEVYMSTPTQNNGADVPPEETRACDYCGATPAYKVVWKWDGEDTVTYLCEECDREEIEYIKREDARDDTADA